MKKIEIKTKADIKDLACQMLDLDDEQKVEFAITLGEEGDLSYELLLMKKISEMILSLYGDVEEDPEMKEVVQKVSSLKESLDKLEF